MGIYTKIEDIRFITYWAAQNPKFITSDNKQIALALEKARFAVLRIDQNLDHGAIIVTDIITQTTHILIDLALNASKKEGQFYICSILELPSYIMTSCAGIILTTELQLCKSILTILKKHLPSLRKAKKPWNNNVIQCVKEIFSYALRSDILADITPNREFYS
jgi:hypothetical protein